MPTMKTWIFAAAINGAIAVAMGALATHVLAARLAPEGLALITLGADYQLWHALGLIGTALLTPYVQEARGVFLLHSVGTVFVIGTVCFSGGLYVLALTGPGIVHWVVPAGGSLLIIGWLGLSAAALFIETKK